MVRVCVMLKKIHQLVQEISYIQDNDLQDGIKVTKILMCLKPVTMIYPLKSDEYPLKSDEYPFICSINISILAIKSAFVGWVLTSKMGSHCHQNTISSLDCPKV